MPGAGLWQVTAPDGRPVGAPAYCWRAHTATPHRLPQGHEGAAAGAAGGEEAEEEGGVCGLVGDARCHVQAGQQTRVMAAAALPLQFATVGAAQAVAEADSNMLPALCPPHSLHQTHSSWRDTAQRATCKKGGPQRRKKGRAPRTAGAGTLAPPAGPPARGASMLNRPHRPSGPQLRVQIAR